MATQKERFLTFLQTCVKSTRATDSNPLFLGGNAPKDYARFLESDRLFDYNPEKWSHISSMYEINDYSQALEVFNELITDAAFIKRDKNDNQGWRRGAISHYVCFLSAQEFFSNSKEKETKPVSQSHPSMPLQQIFYGAPGTGKSYGIEESTTGQNVIRTTFHPDSDYSTFVGAYKPIMKEVQVMTVIGTQQTPVKDSNGETAIEKKIEYSYVPQAFIQAYTEAWQNLSEPVFLVIEEINRGNCAQIFGDIFQLLDRKENGYSSYAINADEDIKQYLSDYFAKKGIDDSASDDIKTGKKLLLPPNLYIWATMNTSDQSLFPIDSAFKRRWDWKYVPIDTEKENWGIEVNGKSYSWSSFLIKINDKIFEKTSSEDKQLGFYFCKANDGVISADKFVSKVLFFIYNDIYKDYGFDESFFDDEDKTKLSFHKYYDRTGNVNEVKVEKFLMNLGIEVVKDVEGGDDEEEDEVVDEDGNNSNSSSRDYSKFAINGNGSYRKGNVVYEAVKIYAANNPSKNAEEIVNEWLTLGVNVYGFVETEEMFMTRKQNSNDNFLERRRNVLSLSNGEKIYVSNQYNPIRITEAITKINAANWNINISKV